MNENAINLMGQLLLFVLCSVYILYQLKKQYIRQRWIAPAAHFLRWIYYDFESIEEKKTPKWSIF